MKKFFIIFFLAGIVSGCALDSVGACVGYSSILGHTYCYSNFSKAECDNYSAQDVNGAAPWSLHSGQTCADLGYNEGSN